VLLRTTMPLPTTIRKAGRLPAAAALATALATALIAVSGSFQMAFASLKPVTVTGQGHMCSTTRTEYFLGDDGMLVHATEGTTHFTASPGPSGKWEDAYWVTGFHNEGSSLCNARILPGTVSTRGRSLALGRLDDGTVTADLKASVTRGQVRLGFDLWLTAVQGERTAHQMERDPRTFEVMVQPGTWRVNATDPGWHRVYVGASGSTDWNHFDVAGLNLTAIARAAGVPHGYYWTAVDAGGEALHGSFAVSGYALRSTWRPPAPHPAPKPAATAPKAAPAPVKVVAPARPPAKRATPPAPRPAPKRAVQRVTVPALTGKSMTASQALLRKAGLRARFAGHGSRPRYVVVSQAIKAGTAVPRGTVVLVKVRAVR
jgi:hypothetical protein